MMGKQRILVVDNEEHMANCLKYVLMMENYKVTTAGSGQEALDKIFSEEMTYDLIITDLWMPEMNGWEMLITLHQKKIDIPALIITATDNKSILSKLSGLGYANIIKKPFDESTLLSNINSLLEN